jgi:hypothetical protein
MKTPIRRRVVIDSELHDMRWCDLAIVFVNLYFCIGVIRENRVWSGVENINGVYYSDWFVVVECVDLILFQFKNKFG